MKKEKDKDLDKIFKKGLGEPVDAGYREEDWNGLEQMLDKSDKRKGLLFWLPILSSAAILLILIGWWLFRPETVHYHRQKQQQSVAIHQPKNNTGANTDSLVAQNKVEVQHKGDAQGVLNAKPKKESAAGLASNRQGGVIAHNGLNNRVDTAAADQKNEYAVNTQIAGVSDHRDGAVILAAVSQGLNRQTLADYKLNQYSFNVLPADITGNPSGGSAVKHHKKVSRSGFLVHPQYALSVLGAPELNGVNSLQQTTAGTNIGLLFSVGVFKKLTISTGALYSIKPYNSYFTNYFSARFNSDLTSINANCRVLDIPLNLDYQFYNKHRNKFSIGSGLSSYIMLHESYQYNYSNPTINSPISYTVPNTNKYIFGILNLQATYTRQVNSKVGLSFTPYMKLPLTGIGANQAKLQTTGIAIGLNWNLNSPSKP